MVEERDSRHSKKHTHVVLITPQEANLGCVVQIVLICVLEVRD